MVKGEPVGDVMLLRRCSWRSQSRGVSSEDLTLAMISGSVSDLSNLSFWGSEVYQPMRIVLQDACNTCV